MAFRIDRVVGADTAAELVNRYRAELRELDMLPDSVALSVACQAYADGYIYVVARPGQVWVRRGDTRAEPFQLRIVTLSNSVEWGHVALCQEPLGLFHDIALDDLAEYFALKEWPSPGV
ncbi:hypothetical protein AB0N09_32790 [Streptomyces erythrochromogenes]|uniref:hypothetical protein n=1 Tax=Streptomyces erythrochromogenes TaxID=285574 RepID=UPI00342578F6